MFSGRLRSVGWVVGAWTLGPLLHETAPRTLISCQMLTGNSLRLDPSKSGFSFHDIGKQRGISTSTKEMASSKMQMADRLKGTGQSVWVEFSRLAVEEKAINLGQGFPDFFPPQYIRQALAEAVMSDNPYMNQYTRSYGHPRFVKALAETFSPLMGRPVDAMDNILVTVGAYGSLYCAFQGLVNPGDEVIIIEPYFDCYEAMVKAAGGVPVFIPLRPTKTGSIQSSKDWKLDPEELASKFSDKTKIIMVNNPNNPLGKVFSIEELEVIANLCKKHDVICMSDEVYEWLVYEPNRHIRIATLPDMWDRTLTIGSAGKTFSVTGWKVGWTIGPASLLKPSQTVHQNCNYTCPTPIQEALAIGFERERPLIGQPECYFHSLPAEIQPKRDKLAATLRDVGFVPVIPEGGYFMIADNSNMKLDLEYHDKEPKDFQFVKWLTKTKKVATIPPSAFYSAEHKDMAANLVRFCFIKEDSTLESAAEIFRTWQKTLC